MLELQLTLPPNVGRRAGLEAALRDSIRDGRLGAGTALPSSRVLATDLGVSRSTVVGAYEQLTAEGYLVSEHGRGTMVATLTPTPAEPADDDMMGPTPEWDFRPGEPDAASFPRRAWLQSLRRVVMHAPDEMFAYPDPRGRRELRETIAGHVSRARSVVTDASGVFVCGGFAAGLGFVADTFRQMSIDRIAVEEGMLPFHRGVLRIAGLEIDTIPVGAHGIDIDALRASSAQAVVVTPANQYPFGVTMSPSRRAELVTWAADGDRWIVEDDYDGEFRYDRRPIGALQGLDPSRIIYGGTASKSLGAGLRMGWLIVPDRLRHSLLRAVNVRAGVSAIDQLALADFIDHGHLDRHVRAMRRRYEARRRSLLDVLDVSAPWIAPERSAAGLHICGHLVDGMTEQTILPSAERASVGLLGLHTHHRAAEAHQGLVIGFSRPPDHKFTAALERLADVFAEIG